MADYVDVVLRLLQARQFESDSAKAAKSIKGVGDASEKTGKQAGIGWKGIAKWGGIATAAYGAQRFLRGAMSTTEELGQSTIALNRTTGMSIKQSSEWAATLKTRGVQTKAFQMGMIALSRQMVHTTDASSKAGLKIADLNQQFLDLQRQGGKGSATKLAAIAKQIESTRAKAKDAVSVWKELGVSMDDVRKGNVEKVLEQVSEGFSKMKNPAERAALTQKLFSRAGIQLAPMLYKGSKAIRDQLSLAGKYVGFNAKNAKDIKQEIADQRELKLAYMGVQVSLGKALLPVMLDVSQVILKITNVMQPFIRNGLLVKVMIIALVAVFAAFKLMSLIATIQQVAWNAQLLITIGIVAAVVIVIALLVVGIIYAWKHFKWFREAVYDVWNALKFAFDWAKRNWPLLIAILGGPIGIVAYEIWKNFQTIKNAFISAFDWVKQNWPLLIAILLGPPALAVEQIIQHFGQLKSFVSGVFDTIKSKANDAWNFLATLPDRLAKIIKKIPGMGILGKALGLVGKATGVLHHIPGVGSIPGIQGGGTIQRAGLGLVGEAGPEIIRLPVGAQVLPLAHGSGAHAFGGELHVRVPVFLDRRQIAEAIGSYTADKLARR